MSEATPALSRIDDHKFAREHAETWKFIKFTISGFLASLPELAAQMGLLYLFRALNVTYLPKFFLFDLIPAREGFPLAGTVYAFMISTCLGYTVAFILNRKATFHANSNIALSTFLYVLLVVFTIFANALLGPAIEGLVAMLAFLPVFLIQIISKIISMASATIWVYPANRFIIHRRKKEPAEEEEARA